MGWFLEHTDPVVKVSIVPRGVSALGYAQHLPEERDLYSREALLDQMTMALGGRAAEEIVFGEVTTGARDDLERVTNMAYAMVADYGMSDRLGPLSYNRSGDDETPLLGKPYSDATAEAIDEEVRAIVDEARSRAARLLQDKRALLDQMADALLEEEVLDSDALVDLLGEPSHGTYVDGAPAAENRDGSSSESGAADDSSETPEKTAP